MEHKNPGVTGTVTDDIAKNVPKVENGYMWPPEDPGLGLELDEERLAQCAFKDQIVTIS